MATYAESYDKEVLSEEGTMSFLDHLDELRRRLIRSALFVFVAFVVCWIFSDRIYNFLQVPVRAAMLAAKREVAPGLGGKPLTLSDLADGSQALFVFTTEASIGDVLIPAGITIPTTVSHTPEGAAQLATSAPVVIADRVIDKDTVIPAKLYQSADALLGQNSQLVVGTVQGAFNLYIKVAFYAAIFFAVPFLLAQTWGFVAPG